MGGGFPHFSVAKIARNRQPLQFLPLSLGVETDRL